MFKNKLIHKTLFTGFLTFSVLTGSALAQNPKIDPHLSSLTYSSSARRFLTSQGPNSSDVLSVLIKLKQKTNPNEVVQKIESQGGVTQVVLSEFITAEIPAAKLTEIAKLDEVEYIEGSKPLKPKMDVVRSKIGADAVLQGKTLQGKSYRGKGVIIGIDGRQKPEITAPGEGVIAALSSKIGDTPQHLVDETHVLGSGTSMASPVVAGAVALLFEKNPTLTHSEIKKILKEHASNDSFTESLPNNGWGAGKLNILSAIEATPEGFSLQPAQKTATGCALGVSQEKTESFGLWLWILIWGGTFVGIHIARKRRVSEP